MPERLAMEEDGNVVRVVVRHEEVWETVAIEVRHRGASDATGDDSLNG